MYDWVTPQKTCKQDGRQRLVFPIVNEIGIIKDKFKEVQKLPQVTAQKTHKIANGLILTRRYELLRNAHCACPETLIFNSAVLGPQEALNYSYEDLRQNETYY